MRNRVEEELRRLIRARGRITFAQFMQACLYSRRGGFYSARSAGIGSHFGTAPMSHPAFGALIARQFEQMWRVLGEPEVFHVVEVGCGDGALARAVERARRCLDAKFARALYYVAADRGPHRLSTTGMGLEWQNDSRPTNAVTSDAAPADLRRVRSIGLDAFANVVGCIVSNELIDNFPVHRFVVREAAIKEVFVTLQDDAFVEILDEPSSPRIEQRLALPEIGLRDGQRGEVCLALEDWVRDAARALDRGFVLTIDYGDLARELYAPGNDAGTLVCYHRHSAESDPYRHIGEQDITCHVDFTALMRCGQQHGLEVAGYTRQRRFLRNLGFDAMLAASPAQGLSVARAELNRIALMTLVEPQEYGDFKVLVQTKGVPAGVELLGFASG